jgi:predicted membrane channel-forming protein YqfA (hemolysin III family)
MTADVLERPQDQVRIAGSAIVVAALGVATAAAFLHFFPRADNVGPTAAALADAFAWILGACLGLLVGSAAAALLARLRSPFFGGVFAGVMGFWIGVAPYVLLTAPSDVSFSDAFFFVIVIFGPGLLSVMAGAALGAALGWVLRRARA